ncbi:conserved hypothetical protein [Ricinus communis]|uniref:TF-B3 domain-containing protein n=1 Tax=Ricinus communis TaxID=3988 RepID=B9RNP9_RICCO|nr:conserved hypothetical protein [Ricinus communis]
MLLPSKPHFFKPLLPGFEHEFLIPVSFFKYLKGQECKNAVLSSCPGKLWPIKINGRRFEDGWKEFTRHHDLHVGDFLVFRHEGDMLFHVKVFDSSTCARDYPFFSIKEEKIEIHEEEPAQKSSPNWSVISTYALNMYGFIFICTHWLDSLICIFKQHMSTDFARLHGLINRRCKMIVMDEEGRSWPTMLWYKKSDGQVFIGCGWTSCRIVNDLKQGDRLRFELIKNGKRPLLKMNKNLSFFDQSCCEGLQANTEAKRDRNYDGEQAGSSSTRRHSVNATSKASYSRDSQLANQVQLQKIPKNEVATESGSSKPQKKKRPTTSSKAKACPSGLQHPFFLYIPMKFARLHCLDNRCCKMILIDQEGRSWPAKLWCRKTDGQAYISYGWRAFSVANDLKQGDSFIFELIGNGKRPVLKIHRLETNPKTEEEQTYNVAQAGSSSTRLPQVAITVRASYIKFSQLRIPINFARRHNLARECSNATLMDERGRSWLVSLKVKYKDIYIGYKWSAFAAENCVREGDVYMLELIKGGEKPVLRIYANAASAFRSFFPLVHGTTYKID